MKRIVSTVFIMLNIVLHSAGQITPEENIICVDVNSPQNASYTYDSAFIACRNLGMTQTGLFLTWSSIETAPGVFDFSYLDIANVYYPAYNTSVDLTIAPIATNHLEVPYDLAGYPLNDPKVISRFKILLDSIFVHIPSVQLSSIEIGSEVDVYLGSDSNKWTQYTNFYSAASAYAKSLRGNVKIASEVTFDGLTGSLFNFVQKLNAFSDIIAISYYPLNGDFTVKPVSAIPTDFARIIDLYPSKPIYFTQYGYPSSSVCESSNALQSQFIQQTFTSWDHHASNIKMIDFTWMHDLSPETISYYSTYYGISDAKFLNFLGSLGLRSYAGSGTDKPAYNELICQANQRGYNNISCVTGTQDSSIETDFTIFPNPAHDILYLQFSESAIAISEIKITNSLEQEVYNKKDTGFQSSLDLSGLAAGVYFVRVTTDQGVNYVQKVLIIK